MLLNAAAILAAQDKRTEIIDCPEWGEGGRILIGTIGAMAMSRLQDWIETLGTPIKDQAELEAEELSIVTCDSPEGKPEPVERKGAAGPDRAQLQFRIQQLEIYLKHLVAALIAGVPTAEDLLTLRAAAGDLLESSLTRESPRRYTHEEDEQVTIRWCAESILDPETYQPAFSIADIEALGRKDKAPLRRIYAAAMDLSLASRRAVRNAEKNSAGTPAGGSGSA